MAVIATYNYNSGKIPITVTIESNDKDFVLNYSISIASISKNTELLLDKIRDEVITKVGVKMDDMTDPKRADYVKDRFKESINYLLSRYIPDLNEKTKDFLITFLMQKSLGLGKIELLLGDIHLEEIAINNASEPVWVYHHKFGWLKTNITLDNEDQIKHYSSLIGRKVGRSITLLTPLLDARLDTGERINATLSPISTKGNTITIRKFNVKPITITNMIQEKTISLGAASLIWASVEYELSALVTGGTASGKTILLSNVCSFFQPNQRVISVEDSVSGDCEIIYKENNIFKKDKIGNLINSVINKDHVELLDGTEISTNDYGIEVFSMDDKGKIKLAKPSSFIRHKVNKKLFEIELSSGRKIKVTGDHSLFNLNDNKISKVKCSELKLGDFIATPRVINYDGNKKIFDLTFSLDKFEDFMIRGTPIKKIMLKYGKELVKNKNNRKHYRDYSIMPVSTFKNVLNKIDESDKHLLEIVPKRGNVHGRKPLPLIINIGGEISTLAGMWLADGCYDKKSIIISDPNKESWDVIRNFAKKYNLSVKLHSDNVSAMINSKAWKTFFEEVLELKGDAYTKKIPGWIFDLEKRLVSQLLKGYFSGDGYVSKDEVKVKSSSHQLLKDVQTLLLRFEIPLRIGWKLREDKTYESRISSVKFLKIFEKEINFIQEYKSRDLNLLCKRDIHDVSDVVPLKKNSYLNLKHLIGDRLKNLLTKNSWKSWQGTYKKANIGRNYLSSLVGYININNIFSLTMTEEEVEDIINLAENDLFWDKVSSVKEIEHDGYVYDLSVPGNESFVCNNVIAHNTRELNLPKYLHWIPMITRESNIEGKGEISMLNLIVNSLRMRPDRIVVGEIRRQREAETLFEAMHTGHSVYATLHANDTEETINRLINPPINVPKTSLPAISMIIIMYRNRRTGIRRVFQISEIEKDSTAKVLMQYDLRSDKMNTIDKSSRLMPELQLQTGFTEQEINQNIKEKSLILSWLVKKNVDDVDEIGRVIATYYSDKQKLFSSMRK